MRARAAGLILLLAVLGACAAPPAVTTAPTTNEPAAWVHTSLTGYPDLQQEMTKTHHIITTRDPFPYAALAWAPIWWDGGLRIRTTIEWATNFQDYEHGQQLDIAAHEAGHIFAFRRWGVPNPPGWDVEEFADCFASAVRGREVSANGGCTVDPMQALALVISTPPIQYLEG